MRSVVWHDGILPKNDATPQIQAAAHDLAFAPACPGRPAFSSRLSSGYEPLGLLSMDMCFYQTPGGHDPRHVARFEYVPVLRLVRRRAPRLAHGFAHHETNAAGRWSGDGRPRFIRFSSASLPAQGYAGPGMRFRRPSDRGRCRDRSGASDRRGSFAFFFRPSELPCSAAPSSSPVTSDLENPALIRQRNIVSPDKSMQGLPWISYISYPNRSIYPPQRRTQDATSSADKSCRQRPTDAVGFFVVACFLWSS